MSNWRTFRGDKEPRLRARSAFNRIKRAVEVSFKSEYNAMQIKHDSLGYRPRACYNQMPLR